MKEPILSQALVSAKGKTISSAQVVNGATDVHGVLLIFTGGTELSIDFYSQAFNAEISHYQWSKTGEAVEVGSS